jgi:aldehyde:ferredoxin oxidoreductase
MDQIGGTRQYLAIDLASEQWEVRLIPSSVIEHHVGGESLALRLWSMQEDSREHADPLCIASGAFAGSQLFCSASLSFAGKSPASGLVESDTSISDVSIAMVSCGWRALVLSGIARRPMVLRIHADSIEFIPSERLIGKQVQETLDHIAFPNACSTLVIGPGGENGVSFACVASAGTPLERRGFGALLGKKHIKAIVIENGPMSVAPVDRHGFGKALERLHRMVDSSAYVSRFKTHGTLDLIETAMEAGCAAVDGCSKRTDPRLFHLGHRECSRKFSLDSDSCGNCPLQCRRKVMRPGGDDLALPDAYGMLALGSNLGNYDASLAMQWWHQAIDLGLHPVSAGMFLGQVMAHDVELGHEGFSMLRFGEAEGVSKGLELIAKGSVFASGKDSSCIAGRHMIPLDPRGAWGEALLMGLGEDFPLVPELLLGWLPPMSFHAKAEWVVLQENLLAMIRSLGMCPHLMLPLLMEASGNRLRIPVGKLVSSVPALADMMISLDILAELMESLTGIACSSAWLMDIGRRTVALKRQLNKGVDGYPADLPVRLTIDPLSNHPKAVVVPYRRLKERYRYLRALDLARSGEE